MELRVSPDVAEKLGYYVYLYVHPDTNKPFYVGKGQGERMLAHIGVQNESRKAAVLHDLAQAGKEPRIDILAHSLPDEETAFRIECAVIDALELGELTNEVRGWRSSTLGRVPLAELVATYAARPVEVTDPSILVRINRLYRPGMETHALYEATRGVWKLGTRRERAKYAMAVYNGVVRAVYVIDTWHPAASTPYSTRERAELARAGRWEFVGKPAGPEIAEKYLGRSVAKYLPKGLQSPVVYVQC